MSRLGWDMPPAPARLGNIFLPCVRLFPCCCPQERKGDAHSHATALSLVSGGQIVTARTSTGKPRGIRMRSRGLFCLPCRQIFMVCVALTASFFRDRGPRVSLGGGGWWSGRPTNCSSPFFSVSQINRKHGQGWKQKKPAQPCITAKVHPPTKCLSKIGVVFSPLSPPPPPSCSRPHAFARESG